MLLPRKSDRRSVSLRSLFYSYLVTVKSVHPVGNDGGWEPATRISPESAPVAGIRTHWHPIVPIPQDKMALRAHGRPDGGARTSTRRVFRINTPMRRSSGR